MNGARTTPWEGLVHCTGTVLDMEAVEDIDEAYLHRRVMSQQLALTDIQ